MDEKLLIFKESVVMGDRDRRLQIPGPCALLLSHMVSLGGPS